MSGENGLAPGWAWTDIKSIAATATGGTPSRKRSDYFGGDIPWVKSGELGDSIVRATEESITEAGLEGSSAKLFPEGTLCIALYGATVGKLGILGMDATTNQAICGVFLPADIDTKYLYYYLMSIRGDLIRQGKGGAQSNISNGIVRDTRVPLAPSPEQVRIVAKIEQLFSDLDAGVAALERAKANLKRYRAAVLKAAVEGKLTEQWRADHPDVEPASELLDRILSERRHRWEQDQLARYKAQGKQPPKNWKDKYAEPEEPDDGELHELPQGWCWATVDAIGQVVGGITKGQRRARTSEVREVPYLRVANVQRGWLDLATMKTIPATDSEIASYRLEPGDILFNEGGDRDKLGRGWIWEGQIEECIHQNHVFRVRPFSSDLQPKLLSHHGNTFGQLWFMRTGKQSVNLASINMTVLKQFPVPLAPAEEQAEIVRLVDEMLDRVDRCNSAIENQLVRSARLRQAILKRAFEGHLVAQDPNDKPATELLARIKAERDVAPSDANSTTSRRKLTRQR